jgi:hypothetical protein
VIVQIRIPRLLLQILASNQSGTFGLGDQTNKRRPSVAILRRLQSSFHLHSSSKRVGYIVPIPPIERTGEQDAIDRDDHVEMSSNVDHITDIDRSVRY